MGFAFSVFLEVVPLRQATRLQWSDLRELGGAILIPRPAGLRPRVITDPKVKSAIRILETWRGRGPTAPLIPELPQSKIPMDDSWLRIVRGLEMDDPTLIEVTRFRRWCIDQGVDYPDRVAKTILVRGLLDPQPIPARIYDLWNEYKTRVRPPQPRRPRVKTAPVPAPAPPAPTPVQPPVVPAPVAPTPIYPKPVTAAEHVAWYTRETLAGRTSDSAMFASMDPKSTPEPAPEPPPPPPTTYIEPPAEGPQVAPAPPAAPEPPPPAPPADQDLVPPPWVPSQPPGWTPPDPEIVREDTLHWGITDLATARMAATVMRKWAKHANELTWGDVEFAEKCVTTTYRGVNRRMVKDSEFEALGAVLSYGLKAPFPKDMPPGPALVVFAQRYGVTLPQNSDRALIHPDLRG